MKWLFYRGNIIIRYTCKYCVFLEKNSFESTPYTVRIIYVYGVMGRWLNIDPDRLPWSDPEVDNSVRDI